MLFYISKYDPGTADHLLSALPEGDDHHFVEKMVQFRQVHRQALKVGQMGFFIFVSFYPCWRYLAENLLFGLLLRKINHIFINIVEIALSHNFI